MRRLLARLIAWFNAPPSTPPCSECGCRYRRASGACTFCGTVE